MSYCDQLYEFRSGVFAPEIGRQLLEAAKLELGFDETNLLGLSDPTEGGFAERLRRKAPWNPEIEWLKPERKNVSKAPSVNIPGQRYRPLQHFGWGLTPLMEQVVGVKLVPTYSFLRIYQHGDVCLVHRDRPDCQHNISLMIDSSDGLAWNIEIATVDFDEKAIAPTFGETPYQTFSMNVGDGLIYSGARRHGRLSPNPNRWSAHVFLNWMDRP